MAKHPESEHLPSCKKLADAARLSVAPMMDWTDRHCRYLHRLMSKRTLLYTEMVTAPALVRGGALHLLDFNVEEHPVAVQIGGSELGELAEASALCADRGYDEINLNIGCPSDRVQSGCFGAILMENPTLVADCVSAMIGACPVEVTVKCRIGVDDQDPEQVLPDFIARMQDVGVRRMQIHARKAWLEGLSPKENREVPPLDYGLVLRMKEKFPHLHLSINGGIQSLAQAGEMLARGMDGVMIGRAAYHAPTDILLAADEQIFGEKGHTTPEQVVLDMLPYIRRHLDQGGRLHQVTRHMLGLFAGRPGARLWRRHLSENASRAGAGPEVVTEALSLRSEAAAA